MDVLLNVAAFLAWYFIGLSGFIFWWTKDEDLTTEELGLMLLVSFTGILSWVIGLYVHGMPSVKFKTFVKKRRDK